VTCVGFGADLEFPKEHNPGLDGEALVDLVLQLVHKTFKVTYGF